MKTVYYTNTLIPGQLQKVLWVIIGRTLECGKINSLITLNEFKEKTGLQMGNISRSIRRLREKELIITKRVGWSNFFMVNNNKKVRKENEKIKE